jgi:hypothetical protein
VVRTLIRHVDAGLIHVLKDVRIAVKRKLRKVKSRSRNAQKMPAEHESERDALVGVLNVLVSTFDVVFDVGHEWSLFLVAALNSRWGICRG